MALSRISNQNSLLGGTRFGTNRENAESMLGKAGLGKPRLTNAGQRAALGNISNRATVKAEGSKGLKEANGTKPGRVAKVTSLKAVQEKENPTLPSKTIKDEKAKIKDEIKIAPPSPVSMDISCNSQGEEAFSKQLLATVPDIDKDDKDNPQLVSEYVNEIYEYMRELERITPIKPKYLDGMEINGRMRGILVDWLVQVHLRFHLLQETLYLTVAIIDRFLQLQEVSRSKLQLVGVTAMLLASKYEEMYAPEIADFVYITDNAYTKSDIRKMECIILKTLDFALGRPLPLHFLRRNSKAGEVDANKHTLAKYLMELTITDYSMVHYYPSQIASAALCLSMKLMDSSDWGDTLHFYSKYSEKELMPIIKKMAVLVTKSGSGKLVAIKTKYQSSKFMRISTVPELKSQVILDLAASADH
jgi:hypothetical protein